MCCVTTCVFFSFSFSFEFLFLLPYFLLWFFFFLSSDFYFGTIVFEILFILFIINHLNACKWRQRLLGLSWGTVVYYSIFREKDLYFYSLFYFVLSVHLLFRFFISTFIIPWQHYFDLLRFIMLLVASYIILSSKPRASLCH